MRSRFVGGYPGDIAASERRRITPARIWFLLRAPPSKFNPIYILLVALVGGGGRGLDAGSSSQVQVPVLRVRVYFPVPRRSKPYGHEC